MTLARRTGLSEVDGDRAAIAATLTNVIGGNEGLPQGAAFIASVNGVDGLDAAAYAVGDELFVVARGADTFRGSLPDVLSALQLIDAGARDVQVENLQLASMIRFVESLDLSAYAHVTFAGHSLGGALVAGAAIEAIQSGQIGAGRTATFTFGALGIRPA